MADQFDTTSSDTLTAPGAFSPSDSSISSAPESVSNFISDPTPTQTPTSTGQYVTTTLCQLFTTETIPGPTELPWTSIGADGSVVLEVQSVVPTESFGQPGVQCNLVYETAGWSPSPLAVTFTVAPLPPTDTAEVSGSVVTFTQTEITPSESSSSSESSESTSSSSHDITGPVVGSIFGAVVIALVVGWWTVHRKRQRRQVSGREWSQAPGKWSFPSRGEKPHELNRLNQA